MMKLLKSLLGAALALGIATGAAAEYPDKPIKIIVPYTAGGTTDLLARTVGHKLSESWKQPVIVDNRPGANGIIGMDLVAKAAPDGYTLGLASPGTHAINETLYKSTIPHQAQKDFVPVSLAVIAPMVMVVNSSVPAKSLNELIAYAKANPGKLSIASGGSGSSQHLAAEMFKSMAGVDMVHVPYKGGGAAYIDLLGGQVQVMIDALQQAMPHIKSGKLRPIAVASAKRLPQLPDVPTIAESGVAGYESGAWYGFVAPAGTPKPVVDKLSKEIARILALPEVQQTLAGPGLVPVGSTPGQFTEHIAKETVKYAKVIKDANVKAD
jgi:tripartite-type tricarboxylate transporter receptor subunit TctC